MIARVWSSGWLAALPVVVAACAAPPAVLPPPVPEPAPVAPAPVTEQAPPPAAPVVEPADVVLAFDVYQPRLEQLLVAPTDAGGEPRARLLDGALDGVSRPPIGHRVVTLAGASGRPPIVSVTVGFGRRSQPHAFGTTPRYVELVAEAHRDHPAIREVLSSLGQFLHDAERPISVRFQAFDTIVTSEPIFGERFFALVPSRLVPGGEIALEEGLSVTFLQVIPMDEQDFIHLNMRGDGAVRAWWSRHRGSPEVLHRWDGVIGQD